jgi:three-Cys-motif partner protein
MPRGTDDRYWELPRLPSVVKHTLLDRYVPQFASMTGSRSEARRIVYLDGFAGRGRYDDGSPASPERILRIAQHQGTKGTVAWTRFFVEAEEDSAAELVQVVDEYVRQGVTATAHQGDVLDVLDDVVGAAVGCPLFLFLDPCGLGIPFDRLVSLLRDKRRDRWPPTEILLNFSLDAVRRIGGHVGSECWLREVHAPPRRGGRRGLVAASLRPWCAHQTGQRSGAGRAVGPMARLVRSRDACSVRRLAGVRDRSARAVGTGRIRKLGCSTQVGT